MPVGRGDGLKSVGVMPCSQPGPTHGHFVLSPVSLASRDQDGGPSDSTIDTYDLTGKWGTVNSLTLSRVDLLIKHLPQFDEPIKIEL